MTEDQRMRLEVWYWAVALSGVVFLFLVLGWLVVWLAGVCAEVVTRGIV